MQTLTESLFDAHALSMAKLFVRIYEAIPAEKQATYESTIDGLITYLKDISAGTKSEYTGYFLTKDLAGEMNADSSLTESSAIMNDILLPLIERVIETDDSKYQEWKAGQ